MRRQPPPTVDLDTIPSSLPEQSASWICYHCQLVTPLYGGGVVAGEVDPTMPIRATAIRGHLRFWWRLLNKHRFASSAELFQAERAIWGGLGAAKELEASKVKIRIKGIGNVQLQACAIYPPGKNYPNWQQWAHAYALFPAQGKANSGQVTENPKQLVMAGLHFDLMVSIANALEPADRESVLEAIRWWATFGGVGARTRRGLGAIQVTSVKGIPLFETVSAKEVAQTGMRLVLGGQATPNAMNAWKKTIDKLKDFRQGTAFGRNPGSQPNRPGRSRWPEPNSIRCITKRYRIKNDGTSFKPPQDTPCFFPRAVFGLPIIFHFQNMPNDRQKDPADTSLQPALMAPNNEWVTLDRMASPIILRPYCVNQNQWHPAALVLSNHHINKMQLQLKMGKEPIWKSSDASLWLSVPPHLMSEPADRNHRISAIDRFIQFFKEASVASSQHEHTETPVQKTDSHSKRIEKARIKFERNGAVTAVLKDGKTYSAVGDLAQNIRNSLSEAARKQIQQGYYSAAIHVTGRELIRVEETK